MNDTNRKNAAADWLWETLPMLVGLGVLFAIGILAPLIFVPMAIISLCLAVIGAVYLVAKRVFDKGHEQGMRDLTPSEGDLKAVANTRRKIECELASLSALLNDDERLTRVNVEQALGKSRAVLGTTLRYEYGEQMKNRIPRLTSGQATENRDALRAALSQAAIVLRELADTIEPNQVDAAFLAFMNNLYRSQP